MVDPDLTFLKRRVVELEAQAATDEGPLKTGGPGGTSGGMETRVAALEEGQKRIEAKIDTLIERVAEMKGQLGAMPSAATFGDIKASVGELKGRVDSLPTTAKLSAIIGGISALVVIVLKFPEIWAFLHK